MLDEDQVTALNLAKTGDNILITGQAGCGKTFLVKEIAKQLKTLGKQVRICCSTGIACTSPRFLCRLTALIKLL